MDNFGLNGYGNGFNNNSNMNNEISFAEQLKRMLQPQTAENTQKVSEPQQASGYYGTKVYEIMKSDNLPHIKPDDTGHKQIICCDPEKVMYVARYNYATEKPDYEKYISEGTIELFKKNDASAEMSQVAEALVAVVNTLQSMQTMIVDKLMAMHDEIEELKDIEPVYVEPKKEESKKEESKRDPGTGRFKKKGEA